MKGQGGGGGKHEESLFYRKDILQLKFSQHFISYCKTLKYNVHGFIHLLHRTSFMYYITTGEHQLAYLYCPLKWYYRKSLLTKISVLSIPITVNDTVINGDRPSWYYCCLSTATFCMYASVDSTGRQIGITTTKASINNMEQLDLGITQGFTV